MKRVGASVLHVDEVVDGALLSARPDRLGLLQEGVLEPGQVRVLQYFRIAPRVLMCRQLNVVAPKGPGRGVAAGRGMPAGGMGGPGIVGAPMGMPGGGGRGAPMMGMPPGAGRGRGMMY